MVTRVINAFIGFIKKISRGPQLSFIKFTLVVKEVVHFKEIVYNFHLVAIMIVTRFQRTAATANYNSSP